MSLASVVNKKYELGELVLSGVNPDKTWTLSEEISGEMAECLKDPSFEQLLSLADWTDFEIHCIVMGFCSMIRPACVRACEKLVGRGLCMEALMLTYEGGISMEDAYLALDPHSLLSRYVWEESSYPVAEREFIMKEWLVRFLITGKSPMPLYEMFDRTEVKPRENPMVIRHAMRMDCPFSMDDIVLPESVKDELKQACDQVRLHDKVFKEWGMERVISYGRGVSVLFSGPSGTGKTMAAQIVATQVGRPLYRVSLPSVVSKYIGETEKNLDEIFDQAGRMRIVLFFDEADALFAKRTEIREGNDKYSNMEAAFLLQKIEEYDGVVVLATNYRQNFDEAFSRRLKFVIDFPFPDAGGRTEIWRKSIPDKLMNDSIDVAYLGQRFELAGGHIRNVVLHAAFLAAADDRESLTMADMIEAVKHEYMKLGKVMTRKELGEYYSGD